MSANGTDRGSDKPYNLHAAEYVLGILDDGARARFVEALEQDPGLCHEVAYWEDQLAEFGLKLPPVTPPASVWRGIQMQTGVREIRRKRAANCVPVIRRWIGWAAAAAVAGLAVSVLLFNSPVNEQFPAQTKLAQVNPAQPKVAAADETPDEPRLTSRNVLTSTFQPQADAITWSRPGPRQKIVANSTQVETPDFVGKIQDYASSVGWQVAGYNSRGALQVVATGKPYTQLWEPSTLELWLLPVNAYEEPISLGLLPASGERILPIAKSITPEFYTDYNKLAVSREPPGGSTTGEPTGDILFITTLTRASSGRP